MQCRSNYQDKSIPNSFCCIANVEILRNVLFAETIPDSMHIRIVLISIRNLSPELNFNYVTCLQPYNCIKLIRSVWCRIRLFSTLFLLSKPISIRFYKLISFHRRRLNWIVLFGTNQFKRNCFLGVFETPPWGNAFCHQNGDIEVTHLKCA